MTIKEQKDFLRKNIKAKRNKLSKETVLQKSNIICDKILNHPKYRESTYIYCYYPIQNEVNIVPVIEDALKNNKTVALPKVISTDGKMIFVNVDKKDDLLKGHYNIPEPKGIIPAKEADLILVPGVVFSGNGKRIGQAGGFYDRFLPNCSSYNIGISYDFQIVDDFQIEFHDIILDEIISD